MTNHPNRKRTKITAIYSHRIGAETYAAFFDVEHFDTNGCDCDTPEIIERLTAGLRTALTNTAEGYYGSIGQRLPDINVTAGTKVLAFYTPQRPKAIIERFADPIIL